MTWKWIVALFSKKEEQEPMPLWAYGVECEICQKSFLSADEHFHCALSNRTIGQHKGKIPLLRRK